MAKGYWPCPELLVTVGFVTGLADDPAPRRSTSSRLYSWCHIVGRVQSGNRDILRVAGRLAIHCH